jgi:hypothetical protein
MNERQMDKITREKYPFNDQSKADRDLTKKQVAQSLESNILNSYRSVNYSFTLAGLKKGYLKDPKKYRESELDLVILKSGGKGNAIIAGTGPTEQDTRLSQRNDDADPRDRKVQSAAQASVDVSNDDLSLIQGFNTRSPGRFDMFIENVEIDTLMAFTAGSGSTLPTQIKFEVIEPYSVNGFIEALHVAAIAAGYPSYLQASFVLKLEFWGYPDAGEFSEPEKIAKSERYFPLGLTGIEVDITERGTRYKVSAVPFNERAFGEPNVIKKPIQMSGDNVLSILANLIKNVNEQVSLSDKDGKKESLANKHDTYSIVFPSWSDTAGWNKDRPNDIASSRLSEILKDNALYKMVDPATAEKPDAYKKQGSRQPTPDQQAKEPEAVKYTPGKTIVQFAENMNIHEAITSVIRDSEYVRNILKDVKKSIDQFGMIDYFMVKIEITNLDIINETTKKPFQNFEYVITPYKVHYTRIPTYGQEQIDDKNLKLLSLREYNYIYTGKNIDIVNFKLNFNTLFFEAVPAAFGNKDTPSAKTGAGPDNGVVVKQNAVPTETVKKQQVPTPPTKVESSPVQATGGNSGQPLNDPYAILAKKMHNAIIDSKASMITGEIELLGDPFYLATGGVGNYVSTPDGRGKTKDGEADHIFSEVLITINFRNPVDINPQTGMMIFDPELIPFSGVYKVNKVTNNFKDGTFKQRLEILRIPGQILDQDIKITDPADATLTRPSTTNQVIPDTTRSQSPSQRLDSSTAMEQLDRGLPSPGLPGELSNFTAATGGLGGSTTGMLMQTPGRVLKSGALASGSSVIGQALPSDMASNIRLNSSGLANINQTGLSSAALLALATNVLTGNIPAPRAVGTLAVAVGSAAISSVLNKSNKGSGIGEGATVKLPSVVNDPTGIDIKFGSTINPTKIASDAVNNVVGASKELGVQAVGIVNSLGTNVSTFAKDVGSKISAFAGTPADPKAIGAQVGLDVSQISGLGNAYQSKMLNQIASFGKNIPPGVNLSQAVNAGVVLDYISPSKIQNIPPTTPYSVAPPVSVDVAYVKEVAAKGGATAVANLYGVSSVKEISGNLIPADILASTLNNVPASQFNPYASNIIGQLNAADVGSLKDKFGTAGFQLSQVTGKLPVLDKNFAGSVSAKYGSSAGASPLDKLVNNLGDPNAPPYSGNDPIIRARLGLPPTTSGQ